MQLGVPLLVLFSIVLMLGGRAEAHADDWSILSMNSSMGREQVEGEMWGMEILLAATKDGFSAVVQHAEIVPDVPFLAKVSVDRASLVFTPLEPDPVFRIFTGELMGDSLVVWHGSSEHHMEYHSLHRGPSFWQWFPESGENAHDESP
ncbi:MAG: hypothetical protein ABIK65_13330 [Candidatus Eisenbacteria bacterium]